MRSVWGLDLKSTVIEPIHPLEGIAKFLPESHKTQELEPLTATGLLQSPQSIALVSLCSPG